MNTHPGIDAEEVRISRQVSIGTDSRIVARNVSVGEGVSIGDGVRISAGRVFIGDGCRIGEASRIVSPDLVIGDRTSIGRGLEAELNESYRVGAAATSTGRCGSLDRRSALASICG